MRRADSAAVCPSFTLRLRPRPPLEVRALLPREKDGPGLREPPPASPRSLRVPLEPDSVSPRLTCLRPQCPSVRPSILHPSSRTGSCSKCRALGATRHRLAPLNYLHVKTPPSGPKLGCHPRTSLWNTSFQSYWYLWPLPLHPFPLASLCYFSQQISPCSHLSDIVQASA